MKKAKCTTKETTARALNAARELEAKGLAPDQAEAIADAVRQSSGAHVTADQFNDTDLSR